MRQLLIICIVLIFTFNKLNAQQSDNVVKSYSLQECIQYALENAERLENARLDVEAANKEVGAIRSAGLPQVNISIGANWNYEIRKSLLPASTFDPAAPEDLELELAFGTKYDGDANIGLSQLIFDGSYFVGLQAAKMYKLYSEQEMVQTKVDVIDAVTKAYYMVLINGVRLERLVSNEERLKKLLDDTDIMYQNGFAEKIDVSRIRVSYNNIRAQTKRMERLIELSEMMLKIQMGLELEEPIELSEKIEELPEKLEQQVSPENFNYSQRIDYQLLLSGRVLQELDMKNYKVQYYPNLYAIGAYGRNTNTNEFSQYWELRDRWLSYGVVGLQLQIPIFDGLRKSYSIQKSKIELRKIDNQKELLEKSIDAEIKQKQDNLATNLEMMEVQKENYELAQEIYNTTDIKYKEGVGSNLEVIEANNSLIEAQAIYFDALYEAVVARIELEKALGLLNDL